MVVSGPWVFPEHVLCLLVVCWKDTFLFPGYYVELLPFFYSCSKICNEKQILVGNPPPSPVIEYVSLQECDMVLSICWILKTVLITVMHLRLGGFGVLSKKKEVIHVSE